jgi:hypothetical protein
MSRHLRRRTGLGLAVCLLVPAAVFTAPAIVSAATAKSGAANDAPPKTSALAAPSAASNATMASGTAQRTFVSANHGSDANPCTVTSPCRNFAAAIAQTAAGGEVIVLDSGGYGPVTIGSSISLIAPPGVYAGVTAFSGNAITVNAGASDVVTLRGLTLTGLGGVNGVVFNSGGALYLQDDTIKGFQGYGIEAFPNGSAIVRVLDTTVTHAGNSGLLVGSQTSGQKVQATVVNSTFADCFHGIEAYTGSEISVDRGVATGNSSVGFYAEFGELDLTDSEADHNTWGMFAYSTLRTSNGLIVKNATGVQTIGGTIASWGNNHLAGNGSDGSFSQVLAPQ